MLNKPKHQHFGDALIKFAETLPTAGSFELITEMSLLTQLADHVYLAALMAANASSACSFPCSIAAWE